MGATLEIAYIHVIVALHAAFAGAFYFLHRGRPNRFAWLFAWCWTIEAVRAAILLPFVHDLGGNANVWYSFADVLCFIANWCLLAGFADLFAVRLPRWLGPVFLGSGIPFVLFGRYIFPELAQAVFGLAINQGMFYGVFANLVVMFVPVGAVRFVVMGWLFAAWKRTRLPGALIAAIFSVPYAVFALMTPVNYLYSYHDDWIAFAWCVRVLGFSIGLVMLMLSRQQAAVEKSEAALAAAQKLARLGSWEFDRRSGVATWSAEMFRLCGRDPAGGTQSPAAFAEAVHPEDRAAFNLADAELVTQRQPGETQFRLIRPDGLLRWIRWQGAPVVSADGTVVRLGGTMQDITERHLAEQRIRHLNRVYAVLSEINQAIVRINRPEEIFDAACRIAVGQGEFRMAWIGRLNTATDHLDVIAHAAASPEVVGIVVAMVGTTPRGGTCSFTRHALNSGTHAVCNDIERDPETAAWREPARLYGYRAMASFPIVANGRAFGTFNLYAGETGYFDAAELRLLDELAADISFAVELGGREAERRRAEAALQVSEERFRQLAENIREVFWLVDPREDVLLYVSPAYELIWGRSCASLHADRDSWQEALHPEDRAATVAAVRDRRATGNYDLEYRIVRPDGGVRWIRARTFPVRDSVGATIRVAGVAEDITSRKAVEEQLRQSQKIEAIGRLSGGIAHDFNNLLTVIKGNLAIVAVEGANDAGYAGYLAEIEEAADRAAALTRQMLTFSRQQELKLREVELTTVVHDMGRMLRRIVGEDVIIELKPAAEPLWVQADAGMLEQVLLNLAVNARDAMPHGGLITIETGLGDLAETSPAQGDTGPGVTPARLTVRDNGSGITPEVRAHIFEPFFTTKEVGKGTGLGLATVYGIVEQHRGRIEVESEPGHGTTFHVYLPRLDRPGVKPFDAASPVVQPRLRGQETILVVEDEESVRRIIRTVLVREGYRVLAADSGAAALQLWASRRDDIDLLLTDIVMPLGVHGFELARRLREDRPDLRVIFTSGYNAVTAGGIELREDVNFIPKPFEIDRLAKLVRAVLDRTAS